MIAKGIFVIEPVVIVDSLFRAILLFFLSFGLKPGWGLGGLSQVTPTTYPQDLPPNLHSFYQSRPTCYIISIKLFSVFFFFSFSVLERGTVDGSEAKQECYMREGFLFK
jgi:hypothetical protein